MSQASNPLKKDGSCESGWADDEGGGGNGGAEGGGQMAPMEVLGEALASQQAEAGLELRPTPKSSTFPNPFLSRAFKPHA